MTGIKKTSSNYQIKTINKKFPKPPLRGGWRGLNTMKTAYIIIAFCLGLFLGHLCFPPETEIIQQTLINECPAEKKLRLIVGQHFTGVIRLHKENESLENKLDYSGRLLRENKKQLIVQRKKIMELTEQLKNCDGYFAGRLINTVIDSLICDFEEKNDCMEKLVAVRDSEIVFCNQSFSSMKDLLKEQELKEKKLTQELNVLFRQQKRKRLQNKVLAAGMLFTSGIITTLYIKSRQ